MQTLRYYIATAIECLSFKTSATHVLQRTAFRFALSAFCMTIHFLILPFLGREPLHFTGKEIIKVGAIHPIAIDKPRLTFQS